MQQKSQHTLRHTSKYTFGGILQSSNVLLTSLDVAGKFTCVLQHHLIPGVGGTSKTFVCCDMPLLTSLQPQKVAEFAVDLAVVSEANPLCCLV